MALPLLAATQPTGTRTIVDLQPFRQTSRAELTLPGDRVAVSLINLNPLINSWFLLTLRWAGSGKTLTYHLENAAPHSQTLTLSPAQLAGIRITGQGPSLDCTLWRNGETTQLREAQQQDLPYAPLCADRLFLRNNVAGTYTHLERITNFLRDHVWGGDRIVGFVRQEFFEDAFIENASSASAAAPTPGTASAGPGPAATSAAFTALPVIAEHLGIDVGPRSRAFAMGRWYPVHAAPGMYFSLIQPQAVSAPTTGSKRSPMNPLDSVEAVAVDYLVAMNLADFDLGFALGTDHPRVGWSQRVLDSVRDPKLAGPDGIDSVAPLVVNGIVNPAVAATVAATFAGGFKREHGAFRYGTLAQQNHGTHYGFIEQGVVFSRLQPQLATLIVMDDGQVLMKTWAATDESLLPHIRFARQNGVPLVEYDEATGASSPGVLVGNWGAGNWSGSEAERLRTLRAGACLLVSGGSHYLVFAYFSTATPGAMARVFMAYGCRYAMHLDMNALEHTYFATYSMKAGKIGVQHLVTGMAEVDRKGGNELAPRFLGFPDDRDFFYLTRKKNVP
jgi:hypothetical protein